MYKIFIFIFSYIAFMASAFSLITQFEKRANDATVGIASIKSNYKVFCSGVLVRKNVVLTAAHCVSSIKQSDFSWVVFGQNTRPSGNFSKIISIKIHPGYEGQGLNPLGGIKSIFGRKNDLAIIKIQNAPVDYYPINIKQDFQNLDNTSLTLVGWGKKNRYNNQTKHLIESYYKSDFLDSSLEFKAIYTSINFACNGDSGGPVFTYTNNKIQVVGLMFNLGNLSIMPCKDRNSVRSVELNHYNKWINKIINQWLE